MSERVVTITFDPAGYVPGFGQVAETWGIDGIESSRDEVEQIVGQLGMTIETVREQMYQDPSGRCLVDLEI